MRARYVLILWVVLLCLGQAVVSGAEIYRWKDGSGKMHYSTNPPSQRVKGKIEVKRNNRWSVYTGKESSESSKMPATNPIRYTTSSPKMSQSHRRPRGDETIVPYNKHNAVIIVDATINRSVTESFAIDTGATYTVISPQIAKALHLRPTSTSPQVTLQTANGTIQVPLVNLDSVTIGNLETPNVTAAVHDVDDSSAIAGLLGLNFLNRFQMTVDSTKHQLIFKSVQSSSEYQGRDCVSARKLMERGRALDDQSEQEISYYERAIARCPDLIEAYYYLGALYINQQDAERAVKLHRQLVQMQPDDSEARFRMGVAYMLQREFQKAEQELQQALRLDPDHQQAAEYLKRLKNQ